MKKTDLKDKLIEKLKEAFDAGRNHQMKPFTTDLCDVYCPSFEQWLKDNESEISSLKQQIADDEITDADIEVMAIDYASQYELSARTAAFFGYKRGVKAFRNGEIKHIKNQ